MLGPRSSLRQTHRNRGWPKLGCVWTLPASCWRPAESSNSPNHPDEIPCLIDPSFCCFRCANSNFSCLTSSFIFDTNPSAVRGMDLPKGGNLSPNWVYHLAHLWLYGTLRPYLRHWQLNFASTKAKLPCPGHGPLGWKTRRRGSIIT